MADKYSLKSSPTQNFDTQSFGTTFQLPSPFPPSLLENCWRSEPLPLLIDTCLALGRCQGPVTYHVILTLGSSFWAPGLLPLACCQPLGFSLPFWPNFPITVAFQGTHASPVCCFAQRERCSDPGCPRLPSCSFSRSGTLPELLFAVTSFHKILTRHLAEAPTPSHLTPHRSHCSYFQGFSISDPGISNKFRFQELALLSPFLSAFGPFLPHAIILS